MSLGHAQEKFSYDVCKLLTFAMDSGYFVRIGEAQRTVEQQKLYVNSGRSKTMNSMHLKKCAIDLHFIKDGVLCYPDKIGNYWESLSKENKWGGNWNSFKDKPHFERKI